MFNISKNKTKVNFELAVNRFMNDILKAQKNLILLFLLLFSLPIIADSIPQFQMKDQYGQSYSDTSVKGKPIVLMGCFLRDVEVCRKQGRKLYWKMQNLLWKDSNKVNFLLYLDLKESNKIVEDYIEESKHKQYENILLDRKGQLTNGLSKGEVYIRIYNKSGKLISSSYQSQIEETLIQEVYDILKKEI
ncbi:peroxiredoxin family protein [Leptospira levettii]|uniref:peroxiredoxin family protein n=1 Tax=Leptospira levettii TaxID=2023178 RepID=UPI001FEE2CB5|nr:peroxiredoxin family protein [Leptospira levettii]